jgi:dihydrofolate reductase
MGTVGTGFSMSLDGFITGPNVSDEQPLGEGGMQLFNWYGSGDTEYTMPDGQMVYKVSPATANALRELHQTTGAIVSGRKLFDLVNGWNGRHPMDVPVVVLTHHIPQAWIDAHPQAPFTFVTKDIESAVAQAQALAEGKNVGIGGADVAQQAIRAGLVDEIGIDLVPVLLGAGIRFFDNLGPEPIELERISVVEGVGVTHLRFRIVK